MSRLPLYMIAFWALIIAVAAACKCSIESIDQAEESSLI